MDINSIQDTNKVAFKKVKENCIRVMGRNVMPRYLGFQKSVENVISKTTISRGFYEFTLLIGAIEIAYLSGNHGKESRSMFLDMITRGTGITTSAYELLKEEWIKLYDNMFDNNGQLTPGIIVYVLARA